MSLFFKFYGHAGQKDGHTNRIFQICDIWRINKMMLFCNLFIKRPSYFIFLATTGHPQTSWGPG